MEISLILRSELVTEIEFLAEFLSSREGQPVTTDDVIDTLMKGDCSLPDIPPLCRPTDTVEASKRRLNAIINPETLHSIVGLQQRLTELAARLNPYAGVDYSVGNLIYGLITGKYKLSVDDLPDPKDTSLTPEDTSQPAEDPAQGRELWQAPGRLPSD